LHEINKRVIDPTNGIVPPDNDPNACYACPTNKQRNGITAAFFQKHIIDTHPDISSNENPPNHTLMIEAVITTNKAGTNKRKHGERAPTKRGRKISKALHDIITTELGDDDIKSTGFTSRNAKIDPVIRVYPGSHHMCITNDDLKKGRGNGTLCKCVRVRLKRGKQRQWKNWEGKKVWTVSVEDVEWVEFEHFPAAPKGKAAKFRLTPQEFTATMTFHLGSSLHGSSGYDAQFTVGNACVSQIPVNSNVATTGHKLQGMSKDTLIVNDWNYRSDNWVYVVLSRVRTRNGLYLMKPLDVNRDFTVPQSLLDFEARIKRNVEQPMLQRLVHKGHCDISLLEDSAPTPPQLPEHNLQNLV